MAVSEMQAQSNAFSHKIITQGRRDIVKEMRSILANMKKLPAPLQPEALRSALRNNPVIHDAKVQKKSSRSKKSPLAGAKKQEFLRQINNLPVSKKTGRLRDALHTAKSKIRTIKTSAPLLSRIDQTLFDGVTTEIEPNGDAGTANATTYGAIVAGRIESAEDEDWFSFSAKAGDIIDAFAFAQEFRSPLDAYLTLYDTSGATILTFNDDYEQKDPRIFHQIPSDGTYYLQVKTFDSDQLGPYELTLTRLGAGLETEPNNSISTANVFSSLPEAAWGEIGQKDDSDYYTITVDAGKSIGIRVESIEDDASPDMVLAIFNAAGNLVAVNDDHLGGRYFTSELALKNKGSGSAVYYLQATTYQSQEVGEYVISIRPIATAEAGDFYAALGDSAGGRFLKIEPVTGLGTLVGFTQFHGASALAINSLGEIFATRTGHEDTPIFRVDPVTGAGFGLAEILDLENVEAFAFDARDRLHAIDLFNQLYRLDLVDEDTDLEITLPSQGGQFSGMAFDPEDGKLFVASDNSGNGNNSEIWQVDLTTSQSILVGAIGLGSQTSDLLFNRDGRLYGTTGGAQNSNSLFVIDKSDGIGTTVGEIGFAAVDGLAAFASHVQDVGVDAVTAPISGASLGTAEKITVSLRNDGTLFQSAFDVSFRLSGPASATATENVGVLIVPAGRKATFTFQTTANLSVTGTYMLEVFTSLSGDANRANDTLRVSIQSGTTAIGDEASEGVPSAFTLYQNYPNPFTPLDNFARPAKANRITLSNGVNPTTTIAFDLPFAENVTISIYNAVGRLVRTLVSQYHVAGQYRISWDGKNDRGFDLPGGVYIYQLRAGAYVSQKKLLLMR
jgi:hypothetical protein